MSTQGQFERVIGEQRRGPSDANWCDARQMRVLSAAVDAALAGDPGPLCALIDAAARRGVR